MSPKGKTKEQFKKEVIAQLEKKGVLKNETAEKIEDLEEDGTWEVTFLRKWGNSQPSQKTKRKAKSQIEKEVSKQLQKKGPLKLK